jgi:hypothetical protein
MIRPVTGCNNRASPSSICIPLIRLESLSWHPNRRLTGVNVLRRKC